MNIGIGKMDRGCGEVLQSLFLRANAKITLNFQNYHASILVMENRITKSIKMR